jgi:hypothetical protein
MAEEHGREMALRSSLYTYFEQRCLGSWNVSVGLRALIKVSRRTRLDRQLPAFVEDL